MDSSSALRTSFLALLLLALVLPGCGSSGGGNASGPPDVTIPPTSDVAGEWSRQADVDRDDCGLAGDLGVTSAVMSIGQDGESIFVQSSGATNELPVSNGSGQVSGDSLSIQYGYEWHKEYSATATCVLLVSQKDDAFVTDDQMQGETSLTVRMTGDSCPLIGERCPIEAQFIATRCPPPGCP